MRKKRVRIGIGISIFGIACIVFSFLMRFIIFGIDYNGGMALRSEILNSALISVLSAMIKIGTFSTLGGAAITFSGGPVDYGKEVKEAIDLLNGNSEPLADPVEETESVDPFELFQGEIDANLKVLREYYSSYTAKGRNELALSIKSIIGTVELIKEHTDEKENNRGNIKRLNPQYLPAIISLLEQYDNLSKLKGKKVQTTLDEIAKTIKASESVFENILSEAVEDEVLNAEVDSKIFLQAAASNGAYADGNTLVLKEK